MEPQDDPKARIRALEHPPRAHAPELGPPHPYPRGDAYMPPPVPPMPPPAQGPYTPPGYGAPWGPPPRKVSAGIPWVVLGIGAAVFMIIAAGGGGVLLHKTARENPKIPCVGSPKHPSHS